MDCHCRPELSDGCGIGKVDTECSLDLLHSLDDSLPVDDKVLRCLLRRTVLSQIDVQGFNKQ